MSCASALAAHAREALRQPDRRLAVEHKRALADVLGQVADALQFVGDLDRRERRAEVDRHRLAQRQQLQRLLFDGLLDTVHALVGPDGRFGQLSVALGDGFDGVGELGFGQSAHLGDRIRQATPVAP